MEKPFYTIEERQAEYKVYKPQVRIKSLHNSYGTTIAVEG